MYLSSMLLENCTKFNNIVNGIPVSLDSKSNNGAITNSIK